MTNGPKHPEATARYWATRRANPRDWNAGFRANLDYLRDTGRIGDEKYRKYLAELHHAETEVASLAKRARYADRDFSIDSRLGMAPDSAQARAAR